MFALRKVIEVVVTSDKETTLAFQEWALSNRILSTGQSSCWENGLRYYFSEHHEEAIRTWFSTRADDALGKKA